MERQNPGLCELRKTALRWPLMDLRFYFTKREREERSGKSSIANDIIVLGSVAEQKVSLDVASESCVLKVCVVHVPLRPHVCS